MPAPTTDVTRRPLTEADLADVCDLLTESDVAVVGFADFTRDEIAADLRHDETQTYGWYAGAGPLVGYGWVRRTADSNQVELDVYVRPTYDDALGPEVLAFLEERAEALVAEVGHPTPWLGLGVYRRDARTRGWLRDAGYETRTTFTRMRVDLEPAHGAAAPPARVVVRRVAAEDDLRVAHRIADASFAEHYGHVDQPFESWVGRLTAQGPDFAQVHLADLDGRPVGVLVSTRQFEEDDDAGYVRTLGVLPAGRGSGVAKALLRHYFAVAARAGRTAVLLHVDVANVTGALRLYESVGMRPVLEIDAWAKGAPLDADAPV